MEGEGAGGVGGGKGGEDCPTSSNFHPAQKRRRIKKKTIKKKEGEESLHPSADFKFP